MKPYGQEDEYRDELEPKSMKRVKKAARQEGKAEAEDALQELVRLTEEMGLYDLGTDYAPPITAEDLSRAGARYMAAEAHLGGAALALLNLDPAAYTKALAEAEAEWKAALEGEDK